MSTLPQPPERYERSAIQRILGAVERALGERQRNSSDIEVNDRRLILKSPNGTRYAVTVDNAGVLGTTAV